MSYGLDIHTKLVAKKAVILARVSSKDQEEGYSIDAQKHRLETYCLRHSLDIIKIFEITESSTNGDRKKFMEMIAFIKKQKEPIALIADKVDRVQRSFKEYPLLDSLIQQGKIELHFNTENYIIHKDSVSQERLMWSMCVIMAQSYVDNMRDNIKRSIEQKIRLGEWISNAPIGYMNIRDNKGKSDVIPDPERDIFIQRLFREYATGAFTLSDMATKAKEWGLRGRYSTTPLSRAHIHRIINNPMYYGVMRIKGKLYPHRHAPLINKDLFDQCQAVLNAYHKKPFKYRGKEFVFRGLITCATTGKVVTADTKKKTYPSGKTAEWTYLRCWKPEAPEKVQWVREEKILEQVQTVLKSLQIEKQTLQSITQYVRDTDKTERAYHKQKLTELQKAQTKIKTRLDGLMNLVLDGLITKDEYETKKEALRKEHYDITLQLTDHHKGDENFKDTLIALLNMASEAHTVFNSSTIAQKRQFLNFLFANLQMKGATLCFTLKKPFDMFAEVRTCNEWRRVVDHLRTTLELKREVLELQTLIQCTD